MGENLDLPRIEILLENPRNKLFPPPGFYAQKWGFLGFKFSHSLAKAYLDPTLPSLEKPFTVAHEMAHSIWVTNEGWGEFYRLGWFGSNSDDFLLK